MTDIENFFSAAHSGNLKAIRYSLDQRLIDINIQDKYNETALIKACANGHSEIVEYLLKNGANPDIIDNNVNSALIVATRRGYTGIVRLLIKAGANINIQDRNNETPLIKAACLESSTILKDLIQAGAKIDIQDDDGDTALTAAARGNNLSAVKILLDANANTELQQNTGETALSLTHNKKIKSLIRNREKEFWVITGNDRVSFVGVYPKINQRITEIFNFKSRERTTISESMDSDKKAISQPTLFQDLNHESLETAVHAFTKLGGNIENMPLPSRRNKLGKAKLPFKKISS